MARIRTIKPEFFTDEDLAELSIYARFIFPGLWCLADCAGRLEDRPKYLKTQLLPYDDQDLNALLDELAARGMIVRYQVGNQRLICIPNFLKHQRLSGKEASTTSTFPAREGEATEKQPRSAREHLESQERKGIGKEGNEEEGTKLVGETEAHPLPTEIVTPPKATNGGSLSGRRGNLREFAGRNGRTPPPVDPDDIEATRRELERQKARLRGEA